MPDAPANRQEISPFRAVAYRLAISAFFSWIPGVNRGTMPPLPAHAGKKDNFVQPIGLRLQDER
jgi:hypothetical protein